MASPTTESRAILLFELLIDDALTREEVCELTGWKTHQFHLYKTHLRKHICPELGALMPRAVADDGYRYHIIDAEHPDRPAFWRGSSTATTDVDSRLRTILRDVSMYRDLIDGRTLEGRKVKLIEQRIRHLVEDLDLMDEINEGLEEAVSS